MIGIAAGASGVTLSSGERVSFESGDAPLTEHGDLLVRIGDDLPYVRAARGPDGGATTTVEAAADLYAAKLAATLRADSLAGQQLSLATQLSLAQELKLAVPGWWSPQVLSRFDAALHAHGVDVSLIHAAEAAVAGCQLSGESLPSNVVVVDARRSFTSVVVVRDCQTRPHALLSPTFVNREGGDVLDAAVLRHLVLGLRSVGDEIDARSTETISAARDALDACRQLRETLSHSSTASLQPELPGSTHRVLLVRSEVDEIATPWANEIVGMVRTAIEQSPVSVSAVVITGGLATMPLLTQRISADLGLEVHVPDNLSTVVARGSEVISNQTHTPSRRWFGWRGKRAPSEHTAQRGAVRS